MRHLGDITKLSGYDVPIVDVVTGGSPCQDLSVAGKRAGLGGERSVLFMDQLRIIKEMRKKDEQSGRTANNIRPRYMVWENVPGAFSSHNGEDFRIVLEETAKVADENAYVPVPQKWRNAGCIMGNGWSIAWRVFDAQFWRDPQRRRRIALVADFGGESAPEILFVRKSVSGDIDTSKPPRKEAPCDATNGVRADDSARGAAGFPLGFRPENVKVYDETATTLCNGTRPGFTTGVIQPVREGFDGYNGALNGVLQTVFENHSQDSRYKELGDVSETVSAKYGTGGNNQRLVVSKCYNIGSYHSNGMKSDNPNVGIYEASVSKTLDAINCGYPGCNQGGTAVVALDRASYNQGKNAQFDIGVDERGIAQSLVAKGPGAVCYGDTSYIVRRLTPMECERLQGYPDGWTDIGEYTDTNGKKKKSSDAARYKALGNSINVSVFKWVLKRIAACYERDATMASLFDGIGGFPYIWEQINGKGSCLWASEIEEFCIAVTKERIG